ncbi:MAG: hypothetical protein ACTSRU_04525 [Candidatus Hodarchaeales archaeon]
MKAITLDIPDWMTKEEAERIIKDYVKRKALSAEFNKLLKGEDIDTIEREASEFRRSFKLRDFSH